VEYRRWEAKEAAKAQFRGLWAAITTPFLPDGSLDEDGLRRNMRHLTDVLHVDGVFCTGIMGEFWSLTGDERRRVLSVVVEEARGKCRVIAHTAHHSTRETIALTRHAQEVGSDYCVLINPYYPPCPDDAMVYRWFREVSDQVEIGLWMFDTGFSGYQLSAAVTARIAELENVCGIKLVRDRAHYREVRSLTRGAIVLSDPAEPSWLDLMENEGQRVHMSSPYPYCLQTGDDQRLRQYTELALAGDFAAARAVSDTLAERRAVYAKWLQRPWRERRVIPIAYLKAWTELLGMAAGPVRPPLLPISDEEREEMRHDLVEVGLLAREASPSRPAPAATD
jgi:4-hydroxy-tetrahydrodipicolinate synthase